MNERRLAWTVRAGVLLLRMLGTTWRVRFVNGEVGQNFRAGGDACVYALWHGGLLPLLWAHRHRGVRVLISEHRDGEMIARVCLALGFGTVRGSTSRGAARALIQLTRELQTGFPVAVTPDGPRGPARQFAPGALIASQRAGVPILPVGVAASRAWRLRSWDRFLIPKPFARVIVAYGPPTVASGESPREATTAAETFQRYLDEATARAEAAL